MTLWVVRAGKHGEQEQLALDDGLVTIGFDVPDLSSITTRKELQALYAQTFPEASEASIRNVVGQLWTFYHNIQKGDLVVLPLKKQEALSARAQTFAGTILRAIRPCRGSSCKLPRK
jgi:restriction system protein